KLIVGSNYPAITARDVENMQIPYPSDINERKKISSILSTWDKAIELKEKLIEQKKEQKKGLMQKLLTGEVRFPGFEDDWKEVKIKDIAEIYLGLTYTPQYVEEGVPFLSVKDLDGDKLNFHTVKYISREEYEKSTSNAKPKKGDILFGRVGTLGNPVILDENVEFCIFVSLGFLRIKNDHVSNYFVKYWMESNLFTRQVEAKVAGSSQKNLNTGWLKEFQLILPEYNEQKAIVNVLRNVDKEINMLEQEKNLLTQQKKGLMQLLLTGKVRVKV
ncbi:MAG TPA: restriction endonuclease subunit S, partial [Aquaticitalea sp.]|nr:restriction endonuclease subunit S [Aquaticitalea sp.]